MWQHIKLSEQIRPLDALACCWDVKQPTNKTIQAFEQGYKYIRSVLASTVHYAHVFCMFTFVLLRMDAVVASGLNCCWYVATKISAVLKSGLQLVSKVANKGLHSLCI